MVSAQFPSFHRPQWFKRLPVSWLTSIISVGFHGVLFAAGPSFPSLGFNDLTEPELAAERRNVPLVELSPAEQQRLPDFNQPFYNFDSFENLAPLDPLFEDDSAASGEIPNFLSKPLPNLRENRSLSIPSARIPFGITQLESRPRTATLPSFPLTSTPQPQPRPGASSPAEGAVPPALPPAIPGQANNSRNPATNAPSPDEPSAADLERRPSTPDANASSEDGTAIAAGRNPTEVLTLEERLLAYTYDVAGTTEEDATLLWNDWLQVGQAFATELEIPLASPEEVLPAPIELPLDYTQQFCLTKEPHKGLVGAWVSPEGLLLADPVVLRSTGYAGLNRQALQYIKTLDFSSVSAFTGYQFEVVVDYDPENCTELGRLQPESSTEAAGRDRPQVETSADDKPASESEKAPTSPEAAIPDTSPETDN